MENNKISQELYNYIVNVLGTEPHCSDFEMNTHTWSPNEDVYFYLEMALDKNSPSLTINDICNSDYLDKVYQIIGFCLHYNQSENINLIYDFTK